MNKDIIRLLIRDCRIVMRIGALEREWQDAQPVLINLECEADLTRRYDDIKENRLDQVIDYTPYYHFIRQTLPNLGHIHLLEHAAEQIVSFCLQDPRITTVRVRIEKTKVFDHAASGGIEFIRTRS